MIKDQLQVGRGLNRHVLAGKSLQRINQEINVRTPAQQERWKASVAPLQNIPPSARKRPCSTTWSNGPKNAAQIVRKRAMWT